MVRPGCIWQSRMKLSLLSCSLLVALLVLPPSPSPLSPLAMEGVQADTDYVLESMQYLHDSATGHAFISPLVEKEKSVEEWSWLCSLPPSPSVHDRGWLRMTETFYVFSAFFDDRPNSLFPLNAAVQVLLLSMRSFNTSVYCNLHWEGSSLSAVVLGHSREIWQRGWDPRGFFLLPVLVSCPIPSWASRETTSLTVSLTTRVCQGSLQSLRVHKPTKTHPKKGIAVCVKGMDFQEDISSQLVEWLEWQYLLGASTVSVYVYSLPSPSRLILSHYAEKGILSITNLSLPHHVQPSLPLVRSFYISRNRQQKRRHELIPYNDCLYRHIYSHEYVLIVDMDEWIVPLRHSSWQQLLKEMESKECEGGHCNISSLSIRNVFKLKGGQRRESEKRNNFLPMLTRRRRSRRVSKRGDYGKSFTSTANVASLFNHFALHRLSPFVSPTQHISQDVALKLHFKDSCPIESRSECPELLRDTVVDHSLDRFENELDARVRQAYADIGNSTQLF